MRKYTHKLTKRLYVKTLGTFYPDDLVTFLGFSNGLCKVQIDGKQFFTSNVNLALNMAV